MIGYGEGIKQEEDWGVGDERPDLITGWGEGSEENWGV